MSVEKCDRCKKTFSEGLLSKMSWFNRDEICMECEEEEKKHPCYEKAKEVELEEVKKGNYNYPGLFANKEWAEVKVNKG